jgi:hypothetical protein
MRPVGVPLRKAPPRQALKRERHQILGADRLPEQEAQVFRGHLSDRDRPKPVRLLNKASDSVVGIWPPVPFQVVKRLGEDGLIHRAMMTNRRSHGTAKRTPMSVSFRQCPLNQWLPLRNREDHAVRKWVCAFPNDESHVGTKACTNLREIVRYEQPHGASSRSGSWKRHDHAERGADRLILKRCDDCEGLCQLSATVHQGGGHGRLWITHAVSG